MEFFRKVRRKIKEGALREFMQEAQWLWTNILRYRGTVAIHILLSVLAIVMSLATSVASKYLIDAVTGHKTGQIGLAAAVMIGMLLGNITMKSIAGRVGAVINVRVQNEIQAEVYERILATDWESLEPFRSGDLLQRLTGDVNAVAGGVTNLIPSLISSGTQFVGALAIILYYDPAMAFIALLGVPVSVICSKFLLRKMREYNQKMKALSGDVMSFYEDSFANITSVKAFDITAVFNRRMAELQKKYRTEYLTYNQFSVRTAAVMSLVGIVVSSGCFGWGVYRLWSGAITYGTMTLFMQLSSTLTSAFSSLISLVSTTVSVSTSAGRIMSVTQLPAEDAPIERDFRNEQHLAIELDNACFRYRDGAEGMRHGNFRACAGDLVAIIGPSGEGKTTMLRMLLGLIQPQSGTAVLKCGEDIVPLSAATRSAFAYVPQGNSMFAGTIEENLRLVNPEAAQSEIDQALKIACAYDFVQELSGGLQHQVGGRGKGLSEGQAQRLAVARALLRKAPILLLDEATSALDEETERQMLQNLMTSGCVRTCIFVTHRPSAMEFCNKRYHVRDGLVEAL